MTTPVDERHFPYLVEYARLYFAIRTLSVECYPLLRETPLNTISNILIAFSDGSSTFAACAVYPISSSLNTDESKTTLIFTLSKLDKLSQKSQAASAIARHGQLTVGWVPGGGLTL